jgi:hypothetical protein
MVPVTACPDRPIDILQLMHYVFDYCNRRRFDVHIQLRLFCDFAHFIRTKVHSVFAAVRTVTVHMAAAQQVDRARVAAPPARVDEYFGD